jgi:hypothetical protein
VACATVHGLAQSRDRCRDAEQAVTGRAAAYAQKRLGGTLYDESGELAAAGFAHAARRRCRLF